MVYLYTDDPAKINADNLKIAFSDLDVSEFEDQNNVIIIHAFTDTSDLMRKYPSYREQFYRYRNNLGYSHFELDTEYKNKENDHIIEIIGINNRNKKYKVILRDKTAKRNYKVSWRYMNLLEEIKNESTDN